MLYIINGTNSFLKESTISSIIGTLSDCYKIQNITISSATKNEIIQKELEELCINISMNGLSSSEFCGIVSLPDSPRKKKNSKSKKKSNSDDNLFLDLINLASMYCSKEKQLIIHLPMLLSKDEKNKISNVCNNIQVEFIDLNYISNYNEIYKFCSDTLDKSNICFRSKEDKDLFISQLCSLSECAINKKGQIEDLTIFTRQQDIAYNQHLIHSSITALFLWSIDKKEPLTFEDTKSILLTAQPKQYIYTSIEKIMKCSTKQEVADAINTIFLTLTKQEIFSILTTLKLCIWDYLKFKDGHSQTRNCRLITNANFKIKDPLTLYHQIYNLREDKTLDISSYKNDLILFLWEQFDK